jgi:ATP synthase protein I
MGTVSHSSRVKKDMSRVVLYQSLIILGFILLLFLIKGTKSGLSALAGALAYWLPTLIFIWRISAQGAERAGVRFLATFILGEGLKLVLCGILFVIFIKYCQVEVLDAVVGLIGAIAAFWLASALLIFRSGASS